MRTIKALIASGKKVYIILNDKATQYRFMSDADREAITYCDGVKPTERHVEDVMVLRPDWSLRFLRWAGRIMYHHAKQHVPFVWIMKNISMAKIIL